MSDPQTPTPSPTPTPAPTPEPTPAPAPEPTPSPLGAKAPEAPKEPVAPKAPEAPKEPIAAAPVKYEFKLPEGVTLDEKQMGAFTTLATELKVEPANAQKLVDFHFSELTKVRDALVAGQKAAWDSTIAGWKTEIGKDPILGAKAAEVQTALGVALDEFGSPEARAAFDSTGAGWNPHVIRFIYNMASALAEGTPVSLGGPRKNAPKTIGQSLYPEKGN